MYDVALVVEEDVAVVTVLDLDQVGDQAVGSTALDEVHLGAEVLLGVDGPELLKEV